MTSPRSILEAVRRLKLRTDPRWRFEPPCWKPPGRNHRIAIVGAGIAGLAAGHLLRELGHRVVLFEARNRPGGRILTLREPFDDGLWADAGALRIADAHLVTHFWARRLGLRMEPVYPDRGHLLAETGAGPSIGDNARLISSHRFHHVMTDHTAPSRGRERVASLLWRLARETVTQSAWTRIAGGMDRLPGALARALAPHIQYATAVNGVAQTPDGIRVSYSQAGEDRARWFDRIVMAVPHTTLRDVAFEPGLSEPKRRLAEDVPNADSIRFFHQVRDRDWLGSDLCGYGVTRDGVEFWQPAFDRRTKRSLLVASAQGPAAARFTRLDRDARMQLARRCAERMFPGIADRVERSVEVCWTEDRWSRGAQSRVDQAPISRADLCTPEGCIHFAGEYTTNGWIDGALKSAHRVVEEIEKSVPDAAGDRSSAMEASVSMPRHPPHAR